MLALHVDEGLSWCAVLVKRAAVHLAETRLIRQGFPVFAPRTTQVRRSFGRTKTEKALLFPGYIFVAVDLEQPKWRAVSHTPGVARMITRGSNVPAVVPISFIRDLMARCDETGSLVPGGSFKAGDRVCITSGPFAGIISTIDQVDDAQRVWILLDILGASRAVTIEPNALMAE